MNQQEYAAIVIPTLNRYEHLRRCIDSLANSSYAQYTDIYISLDNVPNPKYSDGRKKIEEYLDGGVKGFANVFVFKHKCNIGAIKNMDFVLEWASQTHKKFIFSEDDNEFSNNYLEFINTALDKYSNNEDVIAVSGYNYPIKSKSFEGNIYFSSTYFAAFGFAGWFEKLNAMNQQMNHEWIRGMYNDSKIMKALRNSAPNQYCNFVKGMLGYTALIENDDEVWKMDLTYGLYMFSHSKKMIFPLISKVRNWGYDGSGVNCDVIDFDPNKPITHRNFGFLCQDLDTGNACIDISCVSKVDNRLIISQVNEFFSISTRELLRCRMAYILSRIVGIDTMRKIWKK